MSERTCGLCGRRFYGVEGAAYEGGQLVDLCHPAGSLALTATCYELWTVHGQRPGERMVPDTSEEPPF